MEAELNKQLSQKRLIDNFLQNLLKGGKEKITTDYISTRLQLLESYWARFLEMHDNLLAFPETNNSNYIKLGWFESTEENYIEAKAQMSGELRVRQPKSDPNASLGDPAGASSVMRQIQLPQLDLPTFSGEQLQWEGFRDLFKALVHNVEGLAPAQKLQYLKTSLTGEAAGVLANIELTSAGYVSAWSELERRYDNKRVLVARHMSNFWTTPPVAKPTAGEIKRVMMAFKQASRSFKVLGRPVMHWDDWMVNLLLEKIDPSTKILWETSIDASQEFPSFATLTEFLETRSRALESAHSVQSPSAPATNDKPKAINRRRGIMAHAKTVPSNATETRPACPQCKGKHPIRGCEKYLELTPAKRRDLAQRCQLCFNCLGSGHPSSSCPSTHNCRTCNGRHHTLLHDWTPNRAVSSDGQKPRSYVNVGRPMEGAGAATETETRVKTLTSSIRNQILLATAQIKLVGQAGHFLIVRALLDSGSEASFVTERVAQLLKLKRHRVNVSVSGLQGIDTAKATRAVALKIITPYAEEESLELQQVLVLPKLTSVTPGRRIKRGTWPHLKGLALADPTFDRPFAIDVVLGADIYGNVLLNGLRRGPLGSPNAHNTSFGWVLMGPASDDLPSHSTRVSVNHARILSDIQQDLRRFWELEDSPTERVPTPEETQCEQLFETSHWRDPTGRYVVRLPKKEDKMLNLGDSRRGALRIYHQTEARLTRDPELKGKYEDFMKQYLDLNHMEPVPPSDEKDDAAYYMPHHAVRKPTEPNKIRVVFNASFRTTSGMSLNDLLVPGPKLQAELWLVLTRWRMFRVAFSADIIKMFRQILVDPRDTDLQRIFWRSDPSREMQEFRLTTVTYGTASAPYLAIRTLLRLAQDHEAQFPLGAAAIRFHSYVDDFLCGASSPEQVLIVKSQLTQLLSAGGFHLSKWSSNHIQLINESSDGDRLVSKSDNVHALGILWSTSSDSLSLRAVPPLSSTSCCTKRTVLSDVARFFDPLGWYAPVLIEAKVFLQQLWTVGVDWDQPLPRELTNKWLQYASTLSALSEVRLPRWTGATDTTTLELHGFCDASERAYAAAVYSRIVTPGKSVTVSLLMTKSRVAPIKLQSIPGLELCGALLLAELLKAVSEGLRLEGTTVFAWTDAKVVLAWLNAHPSKWKPFVAHRVAKIQDRVPPQRWRYVPTAENPSDLATRGIPAEALATNQLWWEGPPWLKLSDNLWPCGECAVSDSEPPESRTALSFHNATTVPEENPILLRFSSYTRLIRVTSWCLRFWRRLKRLPKESGALTTSELRDTRQLWARLVQKAFPWEINCLLHNQPLPRKSPLLQLRTLWGPDRLIRVGGRLHNSLLTYEERHPIILPKHHHFTLLVIRDAHARGLHAGPQLTRSILSNPTGSFTSPLLFAQ